MSFIRREDSWWRKQVLGCSKTNPFFIKNKITSSGIMVPCTVESKIHRKYIQTSIGFDTESKVNSQLIGNMLKDSASTCKY